MNIADAALKSQEEFEEFISNLRVNLETDKRMVWEQIDKMFFENDDRQQSDLADEQQWNEGD